MNFIDIHTHNRERQKGVTKVVNIFPWENVYVENNPFTFFTVGIHPWYIGDIDVKDGLQQIETWLKSGVVCGVGEAGLDSIKGPEQKVQEAVFEEHIRLSEKYSCPLTVHCVRKYNEILSFRKNSQAGQPWILHGFNSSPQMMEQMVDAGIYISIGADLLKESEKITEVCRLVPTGSLFLETDDSGYEIDQIYQKAAEIRGLTVEGIKDILDDNFRRVFYLCNHII